MPRVRRVRSGYGPAAGAMDRPSRLLIFARRQRRLIKPALLAILALAAGGAAVHVEHAMRSEQSFAPMRAELGRVSGLRVNEIVVLGRNMQPEASVLEALGVTRGDPLLGFSVEQARRRIDRLAFVEHATVERRLPGTVLVQLVERRPFAVWQNQGRFVLIDRGGQVVAQQGMNGKDAEAFAQLPLVVGSGAPAAAADLIDALDGQPAVRSRVVAAVRVGQRRWNLTLRSGADVLLPEGEEVPALARLALLEAHLHLLERPLVNIDLRLPDRLQLRVRLPPATDTPPGMPEAGRPPLDHAQEPGEQEPGPAPARDRAAPDSATTLRRPA
ncbi:cell division protein FtsQ/DivIB [Lichenicoccus sp.]|uniref:cell division protein FtsQ/DivIB n=1 Tax=Lichenicoccus sp. TaxID=2781899 RepID=UPI003D11E3E6